MYITKDDLFSLLDKESEKYQDYCVALNALPDNALFNIVDDDTLTAEYLDKDNELHVFELSYDYDSANKPHTKTDLDEVNEYVNDSLSIEKKNRLGESTNKDNSVFLIVCAILIVLGIVLLNILL